MTDFSTFLRDKILLHFHRAAARNRENRQRLLVRALRLVVPRNEADSLLEPIRFQIPRNPFRDSRRLSGFVDEIRLERGVADYELTVSGWLFDIYSNVTSLMLYVDDAHGTLADVQQPRPGVDKAFPYLPGAFYSGFLCRFRLQEEPPETLTISCKALASDGTAIYGRFEPAPVARLSAGNRKTAASKSRAQYLDGVLLDQFMRSGAVLALPRAVQPQVSVILTGAASTASLLQCLQSLWQQTLDSLEVYAAFECSPETNLGLLQQVRNFAGVAAAKSNLAEIASGASGAYLVFLDANIRLSPGALSALVDCMHSMPAPGLVSGKLLNDAGVTFEAGGIIAASGQLRFYGNGYEANRPECAFRREIDFGTSSFCAVPRDAFLACGGFDPGFASATYKDADICLRLRAKGRPSVFEPNAVAITPTDNHPRATELFTDASFADKSTLFARHSAVLQAEGSVESQPDLFARHSRRFFRHVLVLLNEVPSIPGSASEETIRQLLAGLEERASFLTVVLVGKAAIAPAAATICFSPTTEVFRLRTAEELAALLIERRSYYSDCILSGPECMSVYLDAQPRLADTPLSCKIIYEASSGGAMPAAAPAEQPARTLSELIGLADRIIVWSEAEAEPLREITAVQIDVLEPGLPPLQLSRQLDTILTSRT